MKSKLALRILLTFVTASAACFAPTVHSSDAAGNCRVQIEIKNRFNREHRKTYHFDAKNEEECARIASVHEAAPKPAYILKRNVEYEFR